MAAPRDELDFHVLRFARILSRLDATPPITTAYEGSSPQKRGVWYSDQREHMVGWFRGQATLGSGAYSRSRPNRSAKTAYNRLFAPGAILWIGEALGEEPAIVQAAADAARAEPNARRRPGIMRAHFPWARIAELASAQTSRRPPTDTRSGSGGAFNRRRTRRNR